MEDEKVKQLAETLKKQGLAASMYEAMEKAKSIIGVKSQRDEELKNTTKEIPKAAMENAYIWEQGDKLPTSDYDITKETASLNELMLDELMEEIGVTPEQVKEQEKQKIEKIMEEVNEIQEDLREAEMNPEKVEEIKEEISHVNKEIAEIIEERDENPEMRPEPEQNQEEPEADEEKNQSQQNKEEDRPEEENNLDLTKVFNYKK